MNWMTFPMGCAVAEKVRGLRQNFLTHAVLVKGPMEFEPLCRKVKLTSLCLDTSLADKSLPECPDCQRAVGRLVDADPATAEKIEACVRAARRPCPEIVPVTRLLGTDGRWYGPCGFPLPVSAVKPYQSKVIGYAYRDASGTTYGTVGPEDELRERWERKQQADGEEFRAQLRQMNGIRLASQFFYWLKTDA